MTIITHPSVRSLYYTAAASSWETPWRQQQQQQLSNALKPHCAEININLLRRLLRHDSDDVSSTLLKHLFK